MKKIFTTGLLTILPLAITIYIFYLIFTSLDALLGGILEKIIGYRLPGIGFISGIVLIFLVGFIASNIVGRRLIAYGDRILQRIPLARTVYSGARQIIDAFTAQDKQAFKRVVLLEYPRKGLYALGFVTGVSRGEVQDKTQKEVLNVFVPTTPNPTSGMLVLTAREEVIDLEMAVEEGMKIIISGGLVTPPERRNGSTTEC